MTSLPNRSWSRRSLMIAGTSAAAALSLAPVVGRRQSRCVFVARNQDYTHRLVRTIEDGFRNVEFDLAKLRGKRVLLKPNLVEPSRDAPHMTTHPAVILAAAEVFRRQGARVTVGEAPGHVRDTEFALAESGVQAALDEVQLPFADLNYEDVRWARNQGRRSKLDGFCFPRSVVDADLIVSMPKMKTHHWMGVTAAMKNMYGVIPGSVYGWPKNVLHYAGIPETVNDINASLPPLVTIVDGIECMEGDGPIMGTPKPMGLILVGSNLTAVDATVSRLMQLDPQQVPYLKLAAGRLGPVRESLIRQRGERWQELSQPFQILDRPHLRPLREGIKIS